MTSITNLYNCVQYAWKNFLRQTFEPASPDWDAFQSNNMAHGTTRIATTSGTWNRRFECSTRSLPCPPLGCKIAKNAWFFYSQLAMLPIRCWHEISAQHAGCSIPLSLDSQSFKQQPPLHECILCMELGHPHIMKLTLETQETPQKHPTPCCLLPQSFTQYSP